MARNDDPLGLTPVQRALFNEPEWPLACAWCRRYECGRDCPKWLEEQASKLWAHWFAHGSG